MDNRQSPPQRDIFTSDQTTNTEITARFRTDKHLREQIKTVNGKTCASTKTRSRKLSTELLCHQKKCYQKKWSQSATLRHAGSPVPGGTRERVGTDKISNSIRSGPCLSTTRVLAESTHGLTSANSVRSVQSKALAKIILVYCRVVVLSCSIQYIQPDTDILFD